MSNNQVQYILEELRRDPSTRRAVATLWNVDDLAQMNLTPCCHTSTWNIMDGRLNCLLDQRSGDMPYGVPFNTTQYAELMILLARDLGVKPGILTHVIADAHIYDNQMKGVRQQLDAFHILETLEKGNDAFALALQYVNDYDTAPWTKMDWAKDENGTLDAIRLIEHAKETLNSNPFFDVYGTTDFFKVLDSSCQINGYNKNTGNMGPIDFGDVAV